MSKTEAYQKDIESIRHLMERSVKFISLSGLSGILAGIYALIGAVVASKLLEHPKTEGVYGLAYHPPVYKLLSVALGVLFASVITGLWMSGRKARKAGVKMWDATARRLSFNLAIPLATGGAFIVILGLNGYYGLISPSFLVFYGLALINASPNLYEEVRYLGYSEIVLGLVCAFLPGYGLLFWAIGFGAFHILYGAVMFRKYEK